MKVKTAGCSESAVSLSCHHIPEDCSMRLSLRHLYLEELISKKGFGIFLLVVTFSPVVTIHRLHVCVSACVRAPLATTRLFRPPFAALLSYFGGTGFMSLIGHCLLWLKNPRGSLQPLQESASILLKISTRFLPHPFQLVSHTMLPFSSVCLPNK